MGYIHAAKNQKHVCGSHLIVELGGELVRIKNWVVFWHTEICPIKMRGLV